jgi:hypothetical protein
MQDPNRPRDEKDVQELFELAAKADHDVETDNAYTCTLTMEPFREPVCTPDGNSYEKGALTEHLAKVLFSIASVLPCSTFAIVSLACNAKRRYAVDRHWLHRGHCQTKHFLT